MPNNLATTIRALSPGALALYKRQLAALPDEQRQLAYQHLSGFPELSDILGEPQQARPKLGKQEPEMGIKSDVPLWQKGLQAFGAPFQWVQEKAIEPFASVVTAPFSPTTPETQNLPFWQREQAEYKGWKAPWGVKGAVEMLPWLALPGIGSVAGKGGMLAGRGIAGALGKLGTAGKIAGTALEYSPWGLAEKGTGAALGLAGRGVKRLVAGEEGFVRLSLAPQDEAIKKVYSIVGKYSKERWGDPHGGMTGSPTGLLRLPNEARAELFNALSPVMGVSQARAMRDWRPTKIISFLEQTTKTETPFVHYSRTSGITELNPALRGTSGVGAESMTRRQGEKLAPLSYIGGREYTKEAGLGNVMYIGSIKGRLIKLSEVDQVGTEAEIIRKLKAEGYSGIDRGKGSLVLFDKHPVTEVNPAQINKILELGNGFTFNFSRKLGDMMDSFKKGTSKERFAVSPFSNDDPVRHLYLDKLDFPTIQKFVVQNADLLSKEDFSLGGWFDKEVGKGELNITITTGRGDAMRLGRSGGQKAIFDFQTGKEISVAGKISETGAIGGEGIPVFITAKMKANLKVKGFTQTEIDKMTPQQAWEKLGVPPATKGALPEGILPEAQTTIQKIVALVKAAKPVRGATEKLYTKERGARFRAAGAELEQGIGEEPFYKAMGELKGELPTAEIPTGFEGIRNALTPDDITKLTDVIKVTTYNQGYEMNTAGKIRTFKALQKVMLGNIPQENELVLLEKTFGSDLVSVLMGKMSMGKKITRWTMDLLNAPRALLSSGDISGLLRQGGILSARHPMEALRSVEPMLKAMFSDANEKLMDDIIRARPHFDLGLEHNLYIAPRAGQLAVTLASHEEAFMSNLINKIGFVRASNRAYITGLNDLRSQVWEKTINMWEKAGQKITDQDYKDLAQLINWSTGRGTIPKQIAQSGALVNALLFSPRLLFSRPEFLLSVLPNVTKSKLVRTEAWKTLGSAIGVGASILAAAKLSGAADIELDPRSADFGKLKVGATRLDIWTGYAQYTRFLAQLATAQRKTEGGRIQSLNRKDVIDRFAQTKYSPALGLFTDLLKGETYMGESFPPTSGTKLWTEIYQRSFPLAVQDMIDALNQGGMGEGIYAGTSFLGVGATTYTDEVKKARDKAAKTKYGMTWEEVGRNYGQVEQMKLTEETPAITAAQKVSDERYASGSPTTMKSWTNEGNSVEETYRNAITQASKEFEQTGDGSMFRDKVDSASTYRRMAYGARAARKEYQDITAYYSQPLSPEKTSKMSTNDILRRQYYQKLFSPDMYDQYGNYDFKEAGLREDQFVAQYGKGVLDYIEAYSDARWADKPAALQLLEQARDLLKPYWQITEQVWSMYPPGLQDLSAQIDQITTLDPVQGRQMLRKYPSILRARELIALYKKQLRRQNPMIDQLIRRFYS